ncbi:Hypothetical predicted protein [Octopus vulgaris]|uniref:Uncharacterized protein n=1 Tax=Octopus vulgaris TaxID=6645 RepID=A0AA36C366_OCTVU|nr:Hypothetical predicted protein [Octopus vulgaris]
MSPYLYEGLRRTPPRAKEKKMKKKAKPPKKPNYRYKWWWSCDVGGDVGIYSKCDDDCDNEGVAVGGCGGGRCCGCC